MEKILKIRKGDQLHDLSYTIFLMLWYTFYPKIMMMKEKKKKKHAYMHLPKFYLRFQETWPNWTRKKKKRQEYHKKTNKRSKKDVRSKCEVNVLPVSK